MSPKQDPELFLCLWLDPFDFFPQHLQPQPLILGCRQCNRERVCILTDKSAAPGHDCRNKDDGTEKGKAARDQALDIG